MLDMTKEEKKKWGKIAVAVVSVLFVVMFTISAKFTAERYESDIRTFDQRMQSVWSIVSQKIKMAGFTSKHFSDTYLAGIEANAKRYENDKDAMMKWVKESANQLSPEVYERVLDIFEKAYTRKEQVQLDKFELCNNYNKFLKASLRGYPARWMGYPDPKVLEIMKRTIKTQKTAKIFATGIDEEPENPFAQ